MNKMSKIKVYEKIVPAKNVRKYNIAIIFKSKHKPYEFFMIKEIKKTVHNEHQSSNNSRFAEKSSKHKFYNKNYTLKVPPISHF